MGAVYAGCFYVPVNPMNPAERLRKIMEKLEPEVIISDEKGKEQLEAVGVGLEEKVIGPEILLLTSRQWRFCATKGIEQALLLADQRRPIHQIHPKGPAGNPHQ